MILPSEAAAPAWSRDHLRLHRHLRRHPLLLPPGVPLLLAVSGGQDSMALTALLADLRRLYHWRLFLWHGNHRWRDEAAVQARELEAWAQQRHLPFQLEEAEPAPSGEAEARAWRYDCLRRQAQALGCRRVVTGHTASDRAETVLLNLARGSHRRGLASLPALRPLQGSAGGHRHDGDPILLVRPLLPFSREDTGRLCQALGLPVWEDATNHDNRYTRNRIRSEVLPLLEALHPGAAGRMAALASRLEEEQHEHNELLDLAIAALQTPSRGEAVAGLRRDALARLGRGNRRRILERWLADQAAPALTARLLEELADRLEPRRGPGQLDLAMGWQLRWDRSTLVLLIKASSDTGHGGTEPLD